VNRVLNPSARTATALLLAAPTLFLALFLFYPLQGILRESFERSGSNLQGLRPLVENRYYLERLWFTAWQAGVSTVLTLAVAIPCAYVLSRFAFPGKSILIAIATVPFVLPTIVVAAAFSALLGPNGLVNDGLKGLLGLNEPPIRLMNTIWIILAAHVFYNFALATRIIASYWSNLDSRFGHAAATLGASPLQTFLTVTLPLLRSPILAAASIVFLFSFTSFGVVLVLGGPAFDTLEVVIYRETAFLFNLPVAAALAVVQIMFTFIVTTSYTWAQSRSAPGGLTLQIPRRPHGRSWLPVAGVAIFMLAATLAPMAALAERSIYSADGYTLEFYRSLNDNVRGQVTFIPPTTAIFNSLKFAFGTLVVSVPLGVAAAYGAARVARGRAAVEAFFLVPLGVSAITLGLGMLITLDARPLNLRGEPVILVIAHSLVAYPFVARAVAARLRGLDPRLRQAALTLGAHPVRVFLEVELPLLWRAIVVGAVFAFAISMGEFGATLLISRAEWGTIPVAVFRLLGQPGSLHYGQAMAMSTILMVVTSAGFLLLERLRFRDLGTF
jgi:thiamine transport system permease protein